MLDLKKDPNIITTQKVQLVEGGFTANEARDIICALIEEKINFHMLQKLSICEGQHNTDTDFESNRIKELLNEMRLAKEYLNNAEKNGHMVSINGILNISILK